MRLEVDLADDDGPDDAVDDFGLDDGRLISIEAVGGRWAGRWDRLVAAVEEFRC